MPKQEERGFRYQKRDKESLKERANMKGGNYDTYIKPKFKQWKPKDGKNVIRILPPTWDDARHYGFDIFINFNIGADNQSYLSLSKHGKGEDPLAEARRDAQKEGDKDLAKALSPNQRILYWIIDRNDEDEGPLLWAAPFTFDKSLSNLCIDEDTKDVIFIDDPAKGRDVRFYKEGTGLTTKYDPSKMKVLTASNIHEEEGLENDWLDFIAEHPLPEVLNFYDYDHIKATFDGVAGRKDEDDEKPVRSRRAASEKEPLEGDNIPVRSRRTTSKDEEEVEAPKSRSRRAPAEEPELEERPVRGRQHVSHRNSDPDDEPTVTPARRSRVQADPDDGEDEAPPSTRRTKPSSDDVEEGGGSLRERLARRRSRTPEDD